jgi:hypothetical protein
LGGLDLTLIKVIDRRVGLSLYPGGHTSRGSPHWGCFAKGILLCSFLRYGIGELPSQCFVSGVWILPLRDKYPSDR